MSQSFHHEDPVLESYGQCIQQHWPELSLERFEKIGEGMDSVACLLNGELIFRFPKYASVAAQLRREIALLPEIQRRVAGPLQLRVPEFVYWGSLPQGWPFVGYVAIPGQELWCSVWRAAEPQRQKYWAQQVAAFLKVLHRFPLDQAAGLNLRRFELRQAYTQDFQRLQAEAWDLFSGAEQREIERRFHHFLNTAAHFEQPLVLLHADLSPEHLFYRPETLQLTGVIDFGDLCLGDPDYDLLYLYLDYGPEFVAQMGLSDERLLAKVDFLAFANPLQDILLGLQRQEPETVKEGLQWFRQEVATWI